MEKVVQVSPQEAAKEGVAPEGPQQPANGEGIVKKLDKKDMKKGKKAMVNILVALVVVLAGVGTGWLMAGGVSSKGPSTKGEQDVAPGAKETAKEAGLEDASEFSDTVEGLLKEGGINGEGYYHLEREGGEQKWVYLSSTVIDMDPFVDKQVQVWGETIAAQHAPWLMDVVKIKVIE